MNTSKPYSDRTKRRKIASHIFAFVSDINFHTSNPHTSDSSSRSYYDFVSQNELVGACNQNTEHDNILKPTCNTNEFVNISSDAVESLECQFVCDVGSTFAVVDTVEGDDTDCAEFDDGEPIYVNAFDSDRPQVFIEHDDWTSRSIESDDDDTGLNDTESNVQENFKQWAVNSKVAHRQLTELLHVLKPLVKDWPMDARTLLRTDKKVKTKLVAGGDYYYFGVEYMLQNMLSKSSPIASVDRLTLHINIDGIPLFNSSTVCLWPILGSVTEVETSIFPIAVYCSTSKPTSLEDYLSDFIVEMKALESSGFTNGTDGKLYNVKLGAIICDAPARSFLKCVRTHTSYNCCERCVQRGEWCAKIILPDLSAPLRTDSGFLRKDDADHHTGVSPFTRLKCGMVSNFPLDYLHLVCLGLVRRILHQWLHGSKMCKLPRSVVALISDRLIVSRSHIPREFSRKSRSLAEYKLWKGTELRLFLLYTGPVVLKGLLSEDVYSNFVCLSVAIRILLTPSLLKDYLDYADNLLKYFVQSFCNLYGKDQLVYNVHSLVHLADDARQYGVLDNISTFKYESYLGQLKKLVRKPQFPCTQIVQRVLEANQCSKSIGNNGANVFSEINLFSKPHSEGPISVSLSYCQQYKHYNGLHCFVSACTGDNCFKIGSKIGLVRNILRFKVDDAFIEHVMFQEFSMRESFFADPLDSKKLEIFFVCKLSCEKKYVALADVKEKFVLLPFKHGFVTMPQMHYK